MSKKVREPFLAARIVNFILGITILALIVVVMVKKGGTDIYEIAIFALAAIENFIGATISFSEHKKVRGNICAVICAVFFIGTMLLTVQHLGII